MWPTASLEARADYVGFDDFWEPLTLEIGPAGRYWRWTTSSEPPDGVTQSAGRPARCRTRLVRVPAGAIGIPFGSS